MLYRVAKEAHALSLKIARFWDFFFVHVRCFVLADMLKQLNQTVDPCEDFYEYACGGWETENALEPGETHVSGFALVKGKSYQVLREALANAEKNYSTVRKIVDVNDLFVVCIFTLGFR